MSDPNGWREMRDLGSSQQIPEGFERQQRRPLTVLLSSRQNFTDGKSRILGAESATLGETEYTVHVPENLGRRLFCAAQNNGFDRSCNHGGRYLADGKRPQQREYVALERLA